MKKSKNSSLSDFRDAEVQREAQKEMKGGFLFRMIDNTRCEIERVFGRGFGFRRGRRGNGNGDGDW